MTAKARASTFLCLLLLTTLLGGWSTASAAERGWDGAQDARTSSADSPTWVHTTQADWMAGQRDHLDVRSLDALGTPYGFDDDPQGSIRLRSQPGPWTTHPQSPVIEPGTEGEWDDAVISEAKVIAGRLNNLAS